MKVRAFVLGLLIVPLLGACLAGAGGSAVYGAKVRYAANRPLSFPDLTLEYTGERLVTSAQYPRGFRYHDFVARQGDQEAALAWTDGTGLIAPAQFELGGQRFRLELQMSQELGTLRDGELVLWEDGP